MAERTTHSNHHDDHHGEDEGLFADAEDDVNIFTQNRNNNNNNYNNNNTQFMQIVSSDGSAAPRIPHETYIIQIPRDQIYRVPPPENAEYVQRQCNTVVKDSGGTRRCAFWFLSIFFVLAFIISVIVCVHKFTLSPKPPSFSIKHLVKQSPKSSSKKTPSPGFLVSMETTNPNNVNDLGYNQGTVTLLYKGKPIGNGHFPALGNQGPGISDSIDINLVGSSKGGLPKDLDASPDSNKKSKNSKGSNNSVNMNLLFNVPVRMKTWLGTKTVDFDVNCEFEAEFIGDHLKVQSQKCDLAKHKE